MKFKPALLHFKFDNFASLPSEPDDEISSEVQTDLNGHKWYLQLLPGGDATNHEAGWIGLYLYSENNDELNARFTLSIKNSNGATAKKIEIERIFGEITNWGMAMKRSAILDATEGILKNDALDIEVCIQVKDDKEYLFQPQNAHSSKMLQLFKSGENTDTSFKVGRKVFHVHSLIINAHAPLLGNHCGGVIKNIKPQVFQLLLEFIYSGQQPTDDMILKHDEALIDAANKYELIELKMMVESVLVRERVMTDENVADYLLFADAQSCPLLKEYAISFFLMKHREILESEHSKRLRDSGELMTEIMMLMDPGNNEAENMTVDELRKELNKRKLDVDGSKDTLIARLEEAKRQRT